MELEADVQVGDFKIVRRLGAGGMGIVYLARQVSLNRLVALKVLGTALTDGSEMARFQREAQAVAKLNHPGIAQVHFIGQDRHVCYLAMEYVDGISLREVIRRLAAADDSGRTIDAVLGDRALEEEGAEEVRFDAPTATYRPEATPVPANVTVEGLSQAAKQLLASPAFIGRCCEIVRDAALALAHAHERGVVHRDIKPENILLDRRGKVHLIDFGLARFFDDVTLTNTGALVGTPMYLSPEQVSGRLKIDHRTDIYSLGLTIYELLTLQRPITAPTREGILRQVVTKALPPVSWKNRAVPRDLEGVVHKATAKDPDERYQSVSEFGHDLQLFLDRKPVVATPYRHKFDEREIAAERPNGVLFVAFGFFFLSIVSFLFLLLSPFMPRSGNSSNSQPWVAALESSMICLVCYWIARGLLSGKRAAGWLASLICILFTLASIIDLIYVVHRNKNSLSYNILFLLLLFVFPPSAGFFILVRGRSRQWFRLAERLRHEHKKQSSLR
jgi:serine/threonine protein kinase